MPFQNSAKFGPVTLTSDVNRAYRGIKNNITKAAEKMPEESYGFQPVPEERPFGLWVAHIADSQVDSCSRINGELKDIHAERRKGKAELLAALRESFDICDVVYGQTTEANALEGVPTFRGTMPRIAALYGNNAHDQECYGNMAVYLRLKGLVPPSSEGQPPPIKR